MQVIQGVNPDQQLVKVVYDELLELLGATRADLVKPRIGPRVVLLAGLQGVGKTTACGKMAKYLKDNEEDVLVVSTDVYRCASATTSASRVRANCDTYAQAEGGKGTRVSLQSSHMQQRCRPAAIDQLEMLCGKVGVDFLRLPQDDGPVEMAAAALKEAKKRGKNALLIDTAGRLQADEAMMQELKDIKARTKPSDTLLVVDAMTGQEAAQVRLRTCMNGVHVCACDACAACSSPRRLMRRWRSRGRC
jgi:signal recognition particle subunit SRP54